MVGETHGYCSCMTGQREEPTITDCVAFRSVLGAAFASDPMFVWLFPDDRFRQDASAAWLGLFVEAYAGRGRVDTLKIDGQVVAVALWRMSVETPLEWPASPGVGGLLGALIGGDRVAAVGAGLGQFGASHPQQPHAYLAFLAVSPGHQRAGLGRQVIAGGLEAAAAQGLGVHLETTNPANLAFYGSLGFSVSGQFVLAPDGPPAWTLWRDAP